MALGENTAAVAVAAFVVAWVLDAVAAVADTVADTVAAAEAVAPAEDRLHSFGQEEAWHSDSPASFPSDPDV